MNNYKFRGKTAGKWVYGFLLKNIDGKCAILDEDNTVNFNYLSYSIVKPVNFNYLSYSIVNPETVGQWTGKGDANKKDLYADEIVLNKLTGKMGVIIWIESAAGFFIKDIKNNTFFDAWELLDESSIVSIGNIHDNPEILEDSKC